MQACVIMHNMVIENDRKPHMLISMSVRDLLQKIDHHASVEFADFLLAMRAHQFPNTKQHGTTLNLFKYYKWCTGILADNKCSIT
jgi:hypothetical protein